MTDSWRLDVLPCEILLTIFDYCDVIDLLRISQVCKRFHDIVHMNVTWIKKGERSLVTNQMSERFRKRCNPILSPYKKCLISYNWEYGKYNKSTIFRREMSMPWLQITDEMLWWCGGNYLYNIKRREQNKKRLYFYNYEFMNEDFTKFVLCNNFVISGHSNGSIKYWLNNSYKNRSHMPVTSKKNVHFSYISAIDATSQHVISGSNSGTIKVQKNMNTLDEYQNDSDIYMTNVDRVRSLAIDPTGTRFAVGSCGFTKIPPLHIFDIERCKLRHTMEHEWRHGAGILDMVWDNPHILLTCGYDSHIRKWDLRTEKCVSSWPDPNDATLYCISSDYQYTVITGTQYNCMAVLWDQRQSNFVQVYYVNPQTTSSHSPIYSLRFDSSNLYCVTDRCLVELNFSNHLCQPNDYKKLYVLYNEKSRAYR